MDADRGFCLSCSAEDRLEHAGFGTTFDELGLTFEVVSV
jgi:hypothetical protein